MSIQAIDYVLSRSSSRGLCRLVLISIANHANRHGASCHPSIELIADEAGVGRATAWRCIEKLEADGEIIVQRARGRGHRSKYVMVMGRDSGACAVLFDDPEACVEGEEPRRRGRPPKVPQRNNSDAEKVSQRNKKVPPKMELLEGFGDDDKSSIKVPQWNSKSSIPSRAPASDYLTVNKPLEPSSSSLAPIGKNGASDDDDDEKEILTYRGTMGRHWDEAVESIAKLFPDMPPLLVEAMLGDVERDVGPLPKKVLGTGIGSAYESLKAAIERDGRPKFSRPYARTVITKRLREVASAHR